MQSLSFCDWLISLDFMFSRLIHVVYRRFSFCLKTKYYPIVRIYHIFFIHSSVDGYIGCFHILDTVNNAAMNMQMQIFLQYLDFHFRMWRDWNPCTLLVGI